MSEAADMKRQFQQTILTLQRGSYIEDMKNIFRHEGENDYTNTDNEINSWMN